MSVHVDRNFDSLVEKMHDELFTSGARALGLDPTALPIAALSRYLAELLKWNERMNLVGPAGPEIIVENHFLDSLAFLRLIPAADAAREHLVDIGSGAGFPGMVLKIARPDLAVTLIEPRQKRTAFLRHLVRILQLEAVTILEARLPFSGGQDGKESKPFGTIVTSRAFTDTPTFLSLAAPCCREGGRIVAMKGPKELRGNISLPGSTPLPGICFQEIVEYRLPFSGAERCLLVFRSAPPSIEDGTERQ